MKIRRGYPRISFFYYLFLERDFQKDRGCIGFCYPLRITSISKINNFIRLMMIPVIKPKVRKTEDNSVSSAGFRPYYTKTEYINGFSHSVHIVHASGFRNNLKPHLGVNEKYRSLFTIRTTYVFDGSYIEDISRALGNNDYQLEDEHLRIIKQEINNLLITRNYLSSQHIEISIEVQFTENEIRQVGGNAFIQGTGDIVSLQYRDGELEHPLSNAGMRIIEHAETIRHLDKKNNQLFFSINLVDNEGKLSRRFVNVLGQVLCVSPTRDPTKVSGAYISTNSEKFNNERYNEFKVVTESNYLPLEAVTEENGFFDTIEKAHNLGDSKLLLEKLERENLIAKNDTAIKKQDFETNKHSLEMEKLEREKERLEHERQLEEERRKTESIRRELDLLKMRLEKDSLREKHYYASEDLRNKRDYGQFENGWKFLIESIKFVTVAVGSIFAFTKLFGK